MFSAQNLMDLSRNVPPQKEILGMALPNTLFFQTLSLIGRVRQAPAATQFDMRDGSKMSVLEQFDFETLRSAYTAKMNFAYASLAQPKLALSAVRAISN